MNTLKQRNEGECPKRDEKPPVVVIRFTITYRVAAGSLPTVTVFRQMAAV